MLTAISRGARVGRSTSRSYQHIMPGMTQHSFGWTARLYSSETDQTHDVVVIGSGPGGYVAAIKAAQLGLKTACIDKRGPAGGTCLNVGCIPSKAMLNNSQIYHSTMHDTKKRGIEVGEVKLNLPQMLKAKDSSVTSLTKGIEFLFKKNGVDYLVGEGSFEAADTVSVKLAKGGETQLKSPNVIIATGSEASPFPGLEFDETTVVSSTGALDLQEVPKRMIVIGGGVIGLEMGSVWNRLGSEVTVVEFMGSIGGPMDSELSKQFQKILTKQGMKFKMNTKVTSAEKQDGKVILKVEGAKGGKEETLEAEVILVAIGRRPFTKNLGLDKIGVELDKKGRIVIDSEYNTSVKGVRCIGDATFGAMLAHKAEEEGIAAVELIKHGHGHVDYDAIPSVIYTHPEVAWVGRNEEQLKEAGVAYRVGKFPMSANSRAKTNQDSEGVIKMLTDKETDRVLGVHVISPNAGEAIAEATLAMSYKASAEDMGRTCHAHPTLSEAMKEAAMEASGMRAVHI